MEGSQKGKTERSVCVCAIRGSNKAQGLKFWYFSVQWEGNEGEVGKGHSDTKPDCSLTE